MSLTSKVLLAFATLQLVHSYSTGSSLIQSVRLQPKHTSTASASSLHHGLQLFASSTNQQHEKSTAWKSVVSTNADLDEAVKEIIASVSLDNEENVSKYNLAIFFTSSIYEASAFKYDDLFETLSKEMPGMKTMIGCTTGGVVGALTPWGQPAEVEARASIGITFASLDSDVDASVFHVSPEDIKTYIKVKDSDQLILNKKASDEGAVTFLFATENSKTTLAQFVATLGDKEKAEAFGAVASSVTSLHIPKVFVSKIGDNGEKTLERFSTGVAGLVLSGNICVQTVVARSCMAVGPLYEVTETAGSEVLQMKRETTETDALESLPKSPLEHLEDVLAEIPNDQSYILKRELLIGVVSDSSKSLRDTGAPSIMSSQEFFGQKPTTFDPFTGGITVPSLAGVGASFQFVVRDSPSARRDLVVATGKLRGIMSKAKAQAATPLALLMVGSMERGNKVFRYQSWEAQQLHAQLQSVELDASVPVAGLYSYGAFTRLQDSVVGRSGSLCALMEADSVYAFLTKKPTLAAGMDVSPSSVWATKDAQDTADLAVSSSPHAVFPSEDICTLNEATQFNDDTDGVIVSKRDPESAHPVRVASMDYFVPEKVPQPKNVLESLVWDREKEVDRARERFQMARALSQAKASEGKFKKRDFLGAIKAANSKHASAAVPPLIIEINRASLHNGKLPDTEDPSGQMAGLAAECVAAGAISVGANADSGTFRGQFEDIEALVKGCEVPVFCNDFVVYGYQLFRAKSTGADAIKLMASVLPIQDIAYLVKIAKVLGIVCVVVVSSKVQLLEVLSAVPSVQALSVSSRNMRLWKIDGQKGGRILADQEVITAIAERRSRGDDFVLIQESFTSRLEMIEAKKNGEELLLGRELGLTATLNKWTNPL